MSFIVNEENHDEFKMWQGLQGPYYTPYVSENGIISWTNNGGLQNPPDVNIKGDPGAGLEISGTADTVGDLPETAEEYSIYLVGTSEPYYGYIYADGEWTNIGEIGKGETGEGVPTGGTTGQVLKKASNADYDTEWGVALDPATASPLMDGTAAVGTSTKYAREDHVHPVDTSRASASDVSSLTAEVGTFVRPNLLDNWYFVGGGSQQGGGQFPINQRGQTIYNSTGYTIDRWKNVNSIAKITVVGSGIVFTGQTSDHGYVAQYFESASWGSSQMLTLSVLADGVLYSSTFKYSSGGNVTLPNGLFIYVQANTPQVNIRTPKATSDSAVITAIKLELGSTQTLAHQENGVWVLNEIPNYQQELAKCQRYCIALNPDGSNYQWIGSGIIWSATEADAFIPTPVTMRANPTAENAGDWRLWTPNVVSPSAVTLQKASGGLKAIFTITGGTAGTPIIVGNGGSSSKLIISADL